MKEFDFESGEMLLIDKPQHWSSFDVVKKLRYLIKVKKIGHAGTLDPLATGLLIICTGKFTKKIEGYQGQEKTYEGIIEIGKTTPSYDLETKFDSESTWDHISEKDIRQAVTKLTGEIEQTPPVFSAIKVDGKRAYESARKNKEVKLKSRQVTVSVFEVTKFEGSEIHFKIICSKGTYIRSIAHELGQLIGCGAYLKYLRRTAIGEYSVENAYRMDEFVSLMEDKKRMEKRGHLKLIDSDKLLEKIPNSFVTSGTFDGVHLGHQKILNRLSQQAKDAGGKSVVLTFWPHPRFVLNPDDKSLQLLSTFDEKAEHLSKLGIDYLVKIPFTREFSALSSEEFIRKILIEKIGAKKLVIGYDHHFGKNREGSFEYLKENSEKFGFEVQEIPRLDVDDIGISSTKIRNALLEGKVHLASQYLGRCYELTGIVVEGEKIGSEIGFPTANLKITDEVKLIPSNGVYAVTIGIKSVKYQGMMNIGVRPTLGGNTKTVEVHIFDFDSNIYGDHLTVYFVKRIRKEARFESLDDLKKQLQLDQNEVQKVLSQNR